MKIVAMPAVGPKMFSPVSIPRSINCRLTFRITGMSHRGPEPLASLLNTRCPSRDARNPPSTGVSYHRALNTSSQWRSASQTADKEKYCEPSVERNIEHCGYEKWGFIIYRTTYDEVSARPWEAFKDRVLRDVRRSILESDTPEILDNMDFVFVEDPALEGASVGSLQRRFRAWVREENMVPYFIDEEKNERVYEPRGARHEFFIVVDDTALHGSHVSLVCGFPEDSEEEGREHDKIWHHVIGTKLYDKLGDIHAPWTGDYYRCLSTYMRAQGY
ncbi:uncharacterized protein J7T54_000550 [Emericellopsis cladophorae]|uniref:Uncharacterized protein n=1 Tax=Emericellopsis cladophorae TaxID=2686198 RepID=A0A9P9XU55_9HYPO|nr:uncharacterized protein J7T54_000550 [Emericellopsis cladophorae]KAI6777841.1 hypothetical protein J7T54_000550 [Emericellopsis cladophorae]